ncbi:MAG: hypothetical protein FWE23_03485 [Chitinivibrionia bacterium]|nr:hypothetical protein [Chitinivibrionia bacterium]
MCVLTLVGCSSSGGGGGGGGESIVGTWRADFGGGSYDIVIFNANNTGNFREFENGEVVWEMAFSWTQSGTTVTVSAMGDSNSFTYEGGNTVVVWGDTFTRQ